LAGDQKKARRGHWTILWVDEAAFYLLAGVVRTYAPTGHPPLLEVPLSRDHLAVISGITMRGRVLHQVQDHAFKAPDIARFLRHVLRQVPGRVVIIWDGAPIHRGEAVQALLAQPEGQRLWLEQLPGYAPELNPAEGVWHQLKQVELRNVCCHSQAELSDELRLAIGRLRQKPQLIHGFFKQRSY
jgi:transposase